MYRYRCKAADGTDEQTLNKIAEMLKIRYPEYDSEYVQSGKRILKKVIEEHADVDLVVTSDICVMIDEKAGQIMVLSDDYLCSFFEDKVVEEGSFSESGTIGFGTLLWISLAVLAVNVFVTLMVNYADGDAKSIIWYIMLCAVYVFVGKQITDGKRIKLWHTVLTEIGGVWAAAIPVAARLIGGSWQAAGEFVKDYFWAVAVPLAVSAIFISVRINPEKSEEGYDE